MGCDWHPYLEIKRNEIWEPVWKPVPHPIYWWEDVVDRKMSDGSLDIVFAKYPKDQRYDKAVEYYKAMDTQNIENTISGYAMLWREHTHEQAWEKHRYEQGVEWDVFWGNENFDGRDYEWFSNFGVRGSEDPPATLQEGVPRDSCWQIQHEWKRGMEDWHTPCNIMVSDLLDHFSDDSPYQCRWLKQFAPQESRLVFWFDN